MFRTILLAPPLVFLALAMLSMTSNRPVFAPTDSAPASHSASADTSAQVPSGFDLQGHRGARGLAPENTMPAFRKALDLGVTTLELDVVISKDGEVVVSHEPWMSHVICTAPDGSPVEEETEAEHNLYEMTYEEIAAYDCGSRVHPRFPEQELQPATKPLLRDVIRMAEAYGAEQRDEPIFYNIETKIRPKWEGTFTPGPESFADAVLGVIRAEDVAARATVQSFDPRTLIVAHARQEESDAVPVRLALLIASSMNNGVDGNLRMLPFTPDIYSPDHSLVDVDLLAAAHEKGMQVIPWTVNDPADMDRLVTLGVDGLITDYPNRFGIED
jgi:glycerophosphoryl diester phosphodiesterase